MFRTFSRRSLLKAGVATLAGAISGCDSKGPMAASSHVAPPSSRDLDTRLLVNDVHLTLTSPSKTTLSTSSVPVTFKLQNDTDRGIQLYVIDGCPDFNVVMIDLSNHAPVPYSGFGETFNTDGARTFWGCQQNTLRVGQNMTWVVNIAEHFKLTAGRFLLKAVARFETPINRIALKSSLSELHLTIGD